MVVVSVMNDVWQVFAKQLRKKAAGAGLGFSACNSCTKEWDLEIMGLWGSAGRVEWSMNQKSFLNNEVRHRKGFLFQKQPSSPSKWMFSRAVRPWVFHVQGLGSGGGWEIARTLCSRIKNKNKSALSQTEKATSTQKQTAMAPRTRLPPLQLCWEAEEGGAAALLQVSFPGLLVRTGMAFCRWGNIPLAKDYPSVLVLHCIWWNCYWFSSLQALSQT